MTNNQPTVERMAAAMLEMRAAGRVVDADELANEGFTRAEIAAHSGAARDLANQRQTRQVRTYAPLRRQVA